MARKCCWAPRTTITFAAVFSLVQAAIGVAVAIYGILLYECSATAPDQTHILQFTSLVYFTTGCRKGELQVGSTLFATVGANTAAERTMGVMIAYAAFSGIWIIVSFMLLAQALGSSRIKAKTLFWLHYPWVTCTMACLTLDLVATVLYSLDFSHTETLNGLMRFLNMEVRSYPVAQVVYDLLSIPTVVMVAFCSRLIVIWLIDIILVVFVIRRANDIIAEKTLDEIKTGAWEAENRPPLPSNFPHKLNRVKSTSSLASTSVYSIPRLVQKDGIFTAADSEVGSPSPLQIASQQGFSYEKTDLSLLAGVNSSITSKDATHRRIRNDDGNKRPWSALPPTMLRNQLPWSYFQSRDDPVTNPQRAASEPNLELPPVPVPDYTLHFQRQQQQQLNHETGYRDGQR